MKLHLIHDSTDTHVVNLLETAFSKITDKNIIKNYHPDYRTDQANIFYILNDPNCRYHKGAYYVLEGDGDLVCSAGWNEYELMPDVALALTRAYVNPNHRAKYYMGEYILPKIIQNTTSYEHLYITADSHNSAIYQFFVRNDLGKRTAVFNDWPDIYKKFKPIGKQTIYYTDQYVAEYQR